MAVLYVFLFIILYLRMKSFFIVSYLLMVFSFSFFRPGKTYVVEIIRADDLVLPFLRDGYYLGYGVNIPTVLLATTFVFLLSMLVQNRKLRAYLKEKKEIGFILLSLFLFIVTGFISSYLYSPFALLSFTWLFQYSAILLVCISTFYMFLLKKMQLLITVLVTSSLFQFAVVLLQFLKQKGTGIGVEFTTIVSQTFTGLDEVNTFFRVNGTFMYHNQLALISTLFFAIFFILFLYSNKKNEALHLVLTLTNLIVVILSQTRIMWASIPLVFFLIFVFNRQALSKLSFIFKKINVKLLLLLFTLLLAIVIPRVANSLNSTEKGSGIWIRKEMVGEAMLAIQSSPFIGYGIATNEFTLFKQFPLGVMSVFPAAVHMAFFQLALEVGVVGLILFLLPFFIIMRYFIVNSIKSKYALIYLCGIVIFTSYYVVHPHVFILESQFLGLLLGIGMIGIYET